MRDLIRETAKLVLYAAAILLLFALTRLVLTLTRDAHLTAVQAQLTMTELGTTAREVRTTAIEVRAEVQPSIVEARKTLHAYRGLADTFRKTTLDERDAIQEFNDAGVKTIHHLDAQISELKTGEMADAFLRVAAQSQQTLDDSSKAMSAAAKLLSDPSIPDALGAISTTTENAARMSADAQKKFHLLLFPPKQPWFQRTLHLAETGGRLAFDVLTLK